MGNLVSLYSHVHSVFLPAISISSLRPSQPPPAQAERLPTEIQLEFLNHVTDNHTQLVCCLVHSKWLEAVRPKLFNRLELTTNDARRLIPLLKSLSRPIGLTNQVRTISLVGMAASGTCKRAQADHAKDGMHASVLLFSFARRCPFRKIEKKFCLWHRLSTGLNNIIHLELKTIEFYKFSQATEIICSFRSLESVSLEELSWKHPDIDHAMKWSLLEHVHVISLVLNDRNAKELSSWLISQRSVASIERLCFETHTLPANSRVCELVKALGSTMSKLRFSMTFNDILPTPENLTKSVGVKYCHQLVHLHLDNVLIMLNAYRSVPLWIPVVLSQVQSQVLKTVTVSLMVGCFESLATSSIPWLDINLTLCKRGIYPSLETVNVRISTLTTPDQARIENFIRSELPDVERQNKLKISFHSS